MTLCKRLFLFLILFVNLLVYALLVGWVVRDQRAADAAPSMSVALAGEAATASHPQALPVVANQAASPTPDALVAGLSGSSGTPAPTVTRSTLVFNEPAPMATPESSRDALPTEARITGVRGRKQSLALSCESRSASDWAAYFGVKIDELEFLRALPISDDPDRGFVGDVNGEWGLLPPSPYGVHAGPVARLLQQYGVEAQARRYIRWDTLQAEIAAGRPVIVWVVGHVEQGEGTIYTAADGRRTIVARHEHTVILIGYDETSVLVVDGTKTYRRPLERFLTSWGALRNMAITAPG